MVLLVSRWLVLVPTGCIIPRANLKTWKYGLHKNVQARFCLILAGQR